MLATVNDRLLLRFAISEGKSQRYVKNMVWTWLEFRERAKLSDADPLTLAEFTSKSKDWQALRKNNGYFVGAQFKGGIRHKINARPRQLLTFDIDQGSNALINDLRDGTSGVGACEYLAYSTRTHGKGAVKLRLVIPLPKLLPEDRFNPLSRILAEAIDPDMRMVDPVSFKPSQYMYWPSHCADIEPVFIHHQGPMLDVDRILSNWASAWGDWSDFRNLPRSEREQDRLRADVARSADPLTKRGHVGAFCNLWDIHQAIIEFDLPYVPGEMGPNGIPARYTYTKGTGSNGMVVYDGGHKAHSHHSSDPLSDQNFNSWDMTMTHLFGHLNGTREIGDDPRKMPAFKAMVEMLRENEEFMRVLRDSHYGLSQADIDDSFDVTDEEAGVEVTSVEDDDDLSDPRGWMDGLDLNADGIIKNTIANIILILRNGRSFAGRFGHNEFSHMDCLVKPLRSKSLRINHRIPRGQTELMIEAIHFGAIRQILSAPRGPKKTGWGLQVAQRDVREAVSIVCGENKFHPVRDYLDSLTWDGVSRIDTVWIQGCHTQDTSYYRQTSRNTMLAAVARIYEPGVKFDFMPVLVGPQGLRKSTFVMIWGSARWSGETEGHFDDKKRFVEATLGFWFVENSEMTHFRRAQDDEAIKAMLSGTVDTVRLSYRPDPQRIPRQFIMIGTTNDTNFLRGKHRRIWPIQCGEQQIDVDWLAEHRDQLFAEAVAEYRRLARESNTGLLPLHLTDAAETEHTTTQARHLIENAAEADAGTVQTWLDAPVPVACSKSGWTDAEDADAKFEDDDNLVLRTYTCAKELWERALGRDPTKYDQRAAQHIGAVMRFLEPDWRAGDRATCGKYGRQRAYFRTGTGEL
jgi:predicted P-loop ATPase